MAAPRRGDPPSSAGTESRSLTTPSRGPPGARRRLLHPKRIGSPGFAKLGFSGGYLSRNCFRLRKFAQRICATLMNPAFPEITKIPYEGPTSKNPLAFKHYNAGEIIEGKTMADHLRFSVVYWHTFRNVLGDPFGPGTAIRPWDDQSNSVENACNRARDRF